MRNDISDISNWSTILHHFLLFRLHSYKFVRMTLQSSHVLCLVKRERERERERPHTINRAIELKKRRHTSLFFLNKKDKTNFHREREIARSIFVGFKRGAQ